MISKSLYLNIIIRVIIIVILATGLGIFLVKMESFLLALICLIMIVIATANLIWYVNSSNRKLSFFFDAIRNNDSALYFPTDFSSKMAQELNAKLNEVNIQIQKLKIDNQQKEQYFQTLLENVATGVITFNSKGFIIHANSSVKKMLSVDVLTHIRQIERVDRKLYQVVQRIQPNENQLVSLPSERGTTELSINATSFRTNTDNLILLSIHNIKNELDTKELDSWLKLIRVLMHEIMNSITPITSLSESLSKHFTKNDSAENTEIDTKTKDIIGRGLEVIRNQSLGLMQFVESYRKLTRLPKPDKKIFKAIDLLNHIKLLFESEYEKSCIEVNSTPNNLEIYADENQISQVLINLVKNALQANENNPDTKISIIAKLINNRPTIKVTDNGPGIPKEIIDEIFVPFFTTNENGSGIGLSISKQIVLLHGGNLTVHSNPNKETTFSIEL